MIQLEIVSDPICPWCFIAKRRIDAAAAGAGLALSVRWRPFQLEPDIPETGVDFRARLRHRFGADHNAAPMFAALEAAGSPFGISFDMERVNWLPQTLSAHRLLRWSESEGGDAQHRLADSLFAERFERGGDIGDMTNLASIAAKVLGWNVSDTLVRLGSDDDRSEVRWEADMKRRRGIRTVPYVTVAGRRVDHSLPAEELAAQLAMGH